jgi:hypothetical protein
MQWTAVAPLASMPMQVPITPAAGVVVTDAGSLEEEIEPWPGGAPVCEFDCTLGFELAQDPHLVVEVWCQRIGTGYGAFGDHDHVLFSYQVRVSVRILGS